MSVWFTSDLHFGQGLVAELRGFTSIKAHTEYLMQQWSERVRKDDQVWVLGDVAVSSPLAALDIIKSLPGTKHLISGNHDRCHPMHRDSHKWQVRYLEAFASVQPFARRRLHGVDVLLSHFPYERDRGVTRYRQYRLPNEGKWLLHGHTHGTEKVTITDSLPTAREFHVGIDAWDFAPVPIDTVIATMQACDSAGLDR